MIKTPDFKTIRTDFKDAHFKFLVGKLDAELEQRDGTEHEFYDQYNGITGLQFVVVGYVGTEPVGCGALKPFSLDSFEVKRMFVLPSFRGLGVAGRILHELEVWAFESGATRCVLETGKRQPEAIAFYRKSGYSVIGNYGPYLGIENSVCFEKPLIPGSGS